MRKLYSFGISFFLLFMIITSSAQCILKVKSELQEADPAYQLRATQQSAKIPDANGDPSALIIIKIPTVQDASFVEAHKVSYERHLYYVWLSTQYKEITINTSGYPDLKYTFPQKLESSKAYWLEIDVPPQKDTVTITKTIYIDRKSKWSMEGSLVAGQAVGAELDFTISYFLIGVGFDAFLGKTKGWTTETTLLNAGYTGNFLREKKVTLKGTCPHLYANVGVFFKYVSIACQVGVVFSKEVMTELSYSGNGEGVQDEYIDEKWGSYGHYTTERTIPDKNKKFLTLSPVIKGYIPFNRKFGLVVGGGYTFIPKIAAGVGWGSVGLHVKF